MAEKLWKIIEYGDLKVVYSRRVLATDADIVALLKRLACRHLTEDEVVSASLGLAPHLEVRPERNGPSAWMTTGNPFYIAVIDDGDHAGPT